MRIEFIKEQKKIGYVPQNIYLLDDTIKNNIAYGIDKEFIDNKKIEYCIKNSQLSEFINSLPLKEVIHYSWKQWSEDFWRSKAKESELLGLYIISL